MKKKWINISKLHDLNISIQFKVCYMRMGGTREERESYRERESHFHKSDEWYIRYVIMQNKSWYHSHKRNAMTNMPPRDYERSEAKEMCYGKGCPAHSIHMLTSIHTSTQPMPSNRISRLDCARKKNCTPVRLIYIHTHMSMVCTCTCEVIFAHTSIHC